MEAAFLQALHADPTDETTWLALADWLDDDGQADRAELVRLVRRLRALPMMEVSPERVLGGRSRLRPRCPNLLSRHRRRRGKRRRGRPQTLSP
jgi:uncharacterized protein (TIGR02996 family)